MSSEVVFVGYGISDSTRDDYKGIDARGKVVLVWLVPHLLHNNPL